MKPTLTSLFALDRRIAETKPKPQARGEGIRTVRQRIATHSNLIDAVISAELAAELQADLDSAVEFEPMLGSAEFQKDLGLI